MKSLKQYLIEGETTIDSGHLHGDIERYLDGNTSIEDWKDQARGIMRFIKAQGGQPKNAKQPAGFTIDGERAYLYRIQFIDLDGKEKWLAYEGEYGIAEVHNELPDPSKFS